MSRLNAIVSNPRNSRFSRVQHNTSVGSNLYSSVHDDDDLEARHKSMSIKYENNYILDPTIKIQSFIKNIQDFAGSTLNDVMITPYDQNSAKSMARQATASIHKHVKSLKLDRYRFMVLVQIGEYGNFDFRSSSKFLWNPKFDTFIEANCIKRDKKLFGVATVFCIYFE